MSYWHDISNIEFLVCRSGRMDEEKHDIELTLPFDVWQNGLSEWPKNEDWSMDQWAAHVLENLKGKSWRRFQECSNFLKAGIGKLGIFKHDPDQDTSHQKKIQFKLKWINQMNANWPVLVLVCLAQIEIAFKLKLQKWRRRLRRINIICILFSVPFLFFPP